MTRSMTGFAERRGEAEGQEWRWELRSVNGRGLDLRLRLPDRVDGLEPAAREALAGRASRGSVTLSCRLVARADAPSPRPLDEAALAAAVEMLAAIRSRAGDAGLETRPASPTEVLSLPGVVREGRDDPDADALRAAILADLGGLVEEWDAVRIAEGGRLAGALEQRLARIEALTGEVEAAAAARDADRFATLRAAVARAAEEAALDEARLMQEVALIVVRADVSEEVDRLRAHVEAARDLLDAEGPVGRRLDFLVQEFAREANTVCSKAQSQAVTAAGLELKVVVDQMREQVQNLE